MGFDDNLDTPLNGDKDKDKGKGQIIAIFLAVIFAFTCLGTVFVLFPVSNPMTLVGGNFGTGIFYAALISLGLFILYLIYRVVKSVVRDIFVSVCDELGINADELIDDSKKMVKDEALALVGKKERESDHYIELDVPVEDDADVDAGTGNKS